MDIKGIEIQQREFLEESRIKLERLEEMKNNFTKYINEFQAKYTSENELLKNELKTLQNDLIEREKFIENLTENLKNAELFGETLQKNFDIVCEQNEKEIHELKNRLIISTQDFEKEKANRTYEFETKNKEFQTVIDELKNQLKKSQHLHEQEKKSKINLNAELQSLKYENENLIENEKKLNFKIQTLNDEIVEKKSEIIKSYEFRNQDKEMLEKMINDEKKLLKDSELRIYELNREISNLYDSIKDKEETIIDLKKRLDKEIKSANGIILSQDDKIKATTEAQNLTYFFQNNTLKSSIQELKAKNDELLNRIEKDKKIIEENKVIEEKKILELYKVIEQSKKIEEEKDLIIEEKIKKIIEENKVIEEKKILELYKVIEQSKKIEEEKDLIIEEKIKKIEVLENACKKFEDEYNNLENDYKSLDNDYKSLYDALIYLSNNL